MKGVNKTIRRRRFEGKTDYKARMALIKSGKPRLVIRKTNRYVIAQLVLTEIAQDKVIATAISKDLISKGWPEAMSGSLKSRAAAYLTGLMLGNKVKAKYKEAIVDFGMNRNVKKSRIYATIKGFIDSGVKVPCSEEVLPTKEEMANEKTDKILAKLEKSI
jgi:large subunit ribosomal protein L18